VDRCILGYKKPSFIHLPDTLFWSKNKIQGGFMTKAEAQKRMNELNWMRDRVQDEIREADQRLKRAIEEGRGLLSEHPGLSLKAPKLIELPCGCLSPAKSKYELCPHYRRSCGL